MPYLFVFFVCLDLLVQSSLIVPLHCDRLLLLLVVAADLITELATLSLLENQHHSHVGY